MINRIKIYVYVGKRVKIYDFLGEWFPEMWTGFLFATEICCIVARFHVIEAKKMR